MYASNYLRGNYEFLPFFQVIASERAHQLFSKMDFDGNGEISEEEFIQRCMEDEYLVKMFLKFYLCYIKNQMIPTKQYP